MRHKIKILALVGCLFLLAGCNKEKAATPAEGKYFYDFDEVVYYTIDEGKVKRIFDQNNNSETDSITRDFFYDWEKKGLDTNAVHKLSRTYYTSYKIDTLRYPQLREVLRERSPKGDGSETACAPEFRDIFIFKSKGRMIGMSKICYTCGKFDFVGTDANTTNFGDNGEFGMLKRVVSKNGK